MLNTFSKIFWLILGEKFLNTLWPGSVVTIEKRTQLACCEGV